MQAIERAACAAAIAVFTSAGSAGELPAVDDPSFAAFLPGFLEGTERFMRGDTALWKANASHADDALILGAWGAWEKGWDEVSARYDWAGARFLDSEASLEVEILNAMTSGDLAFTTAIERASVRLAGQDEARPMALRATQVFRKESGAWKLILRHADPLVEKTATETVIATD